MRDGELYTWNIDSGLIEQKTHFVKSKDGEPNRDSKDEWLYQDQLDIFDVLQERKAKKDTGEQISKNWSPWSLWKLKRAENKLSALRWTHRVRT